MTVQIGKYTKNCDVVFIDRIRLIKYRVLLKTHTVKIAFYVLVLRTPLNQDVRLIEVVEGPAMQAVRSITFVEIEIYINIL